MNAGCEWLTDRLLIDYKSGVVLRKRIYIYLIYQIEALQD